MNGCARKSARSTTTRACNSFLSFFLVFILPQLVFRCARKLVWRPNSIQRDQLGLSFAADFPLFGPQTRKPYRCRFNFMNSLLLSPLLVDRLNEGNEQASERPSQLSQLSNSELPAIDWFKTAAAAGCAIRKCEAMKLRLSWPFSESTSSSVGFKKIFNAAKERTNELEMEIEK